MSQSGLIMASLESQQNGNISVLNTKLDYSEEKIESTFSNFDADKDGKLNFTEFARFLDTLYNGHSLRKMDEQTKRDFMHSIDTNQDSFIDMSEFKHAWSHCFSKVMKPVSALIIVDVQYDFIDGTLALRNCPAQQEGAEVVPVINKLLDLAKFDVIIYSLDWHPSTHISFVENIDKYPICPGSQKPLAEYKVYDEVEFDLEPRRSQVLWPTHCVQGSSGAKLDENLKVLENSVYIYKGTKTNIDSYSAFYDNMKLSQTALHQELQRHDVTDVYVCGLAYDVCVAATTRDAVDLGYRTVLIDDACRGVSLENIEKCKKELSDHGALIIHSNDVVKLVNKETSSIDLGLFSAQNMPMCTSSSS